MDTDDGTIPLDDTYTQTEEYNGRTYQQYALSNKTYFAPIDEEEIARLETADGVLRRVFDDRLIFPPVTSPQRILDLGCGGGDWAVEVSEQYPEAEVLGIDISPHMLPEEPPENLDLQIDDLNGSFTFEPNHYDIVHSQMVAGGIHASRWRSYINDIFRVVRPGGWCQMVEVYFNAQSDNGNLTSDHALSKWSRNYLQSMNPYKDPRAPLQLASWMRSTGFKEVESKLITLPMSGWSREARNQAIGEANVDNVHELLYSIALYPMTHLKGMSMDEFETLVRDAREEANDASLKAYFPLYVCIGRKPGG